MLTKIRGDARKDMYMSDNTMWGDPTSKKDKFALISKGLIDMPLDDKDPNHINLIKFGAKVAILHSPVDTYLSGSYTAISGSTGVTIDSDTDIELKL